MRRRQILKAGLGSAAAAALSAPAIAQGAPSIRWRLTSSFPKSLDITYGATEQFCRYVAELTDGRFVIQQFAA